MVPRGSPILYWTTRGSGGGVEIGAAKPGKKDIDGERQHTPKAHHVIPHQALQHPRAEPRVQMAPKHRSGDVKPASHLSLRETMHVLRQIVREESTFGLDLGSTDQRRPLDAGKVDKESGDEGCDERCRRAEACLVNIGEGDAGGCEWRDFGEGGEGAREVQRGELCRIRMAIVGGEHDNPYLFTLRVKVVIANDGDLNPARQGPSDGSEAGDLCGDRDRALESQMNKLVFAGADTAMRLISGELVQGRLLTLWQHPRPPPTHYPAPQHNPRSRSQTAGTAPESDWGHRVGVHERRYRSARKLRRPSHDTWGPVPSSLRR